MHVTTRILRLAGTVALSACAAAPAGERVAAETPAILQATLKQDWQEGPTDGRVCLDPRILSATGAPDTVPVLWEPAVLATLLSDTLVSIDTSIAGLRTGAPRACAPRRGMASIKFGQPLLRGDTAMLSSTAWWPASANDAEWRLVRYVTLARDSSVWRIVGYPDMKFQPLIPER